MLTINFHMEIFIWKFFHILTIISKFAYFSLSCFLCYQFHQKLDPKYVWWQDFSIRLYHQRRAIFSSSVDYEVHVVIRHKPRPFSTPFEFIAAGPIECYKTKLFSIDFYESLFSWIFTQVLAPIKQLNGIEWRKDLKHRQKVTG